MKRLSLVVCLLLISAVSQAQPSVELVERTALNGRVSLLVPSDFSPLSEERLLLKYPSSNRPTEVLSNERGTVNIALNHTGNALAPEEVANAHAAIEQMFKNLYPSARWNRSEVVVREGRSYIVLDLWTPALDTEIRNIITGTSVDGRFLLVSFNVTRELEKTWGSVGTRIKNSIHVHE